VEFKDSLGIKGNFSDQTFLMYRVELKERYYTRTMSSCLL